MSYIYQIHKTDGYEYNSYQLTFKSNDKLDVSDGPLTKSIYKYFNLEELPENADYNIYYYILRFDEKDFKKLPKGFGNNLTKL